MTKPPGPARISRTLWVAGFVAGIAVIVAGFLGRDAHFERLKSLIATMVQDSDAKAVDGATAVVFLGSLALLALVFVVEAVLVAVVFKRRTWARWALMPVLLLNAVVIVMTRDFVVAPGPDGLMATVLLAAQFVLAGAGLVLLFLPPTTAWLLSGRRQ